jgi:hypothetical protein
VNEISSPPRLRRTKVVGTAKRLAIREYVPLGSWIFSWFMIGLAVGHADAVRLLAANAFVQVIRNVCTVEAMQVLGRRCGAEDGVFKAARRAALRIEVKSLAACVAAMALLCFILNWRGLQEAAAMVAIAACAIPARNPLALLVARRERIATFRLGSAITFAIGSGLVFLFGLHWAAAAAVLALREWGGLVTTLLLAPPRERPGRVWTDPLTFAEAARRTEGSARQKLSYRLISSLASLLLGPFGNFAARTSREMGKLDRRLARLVPRSKSGFVLFTIGTAGTSAFFLFVSREPSTLLASAAFARLASSGAAVLLWWRYGGETVEDEEPDEE